MLRDLHKGEVVDEETTLQEQNGKRYQHDVTTHLEVLLLDAI